MLYNNSCNSPPMTEKPAMVSLTPNEAAAPLLEVGEEDDEVEVPVLVPPREVASAVVLQVNVP